MIVASRFFVRQQIRGSSAERDIGQDTAPDVAIRYRGDQVPVRIDQQRHAFAVPADAIEHVADPGFEKHKIGFIIGGVHAVFRRAAALVDDNVRLH